MARLIIICADCSGKKEHRAKGLCNTCYSRRYRRENPDYTRRYWREHREKMLADKRRYKEENREKILADQRCDYADHREQYRAYYRHWQKENPEVGKAKQARREARKRNLPDTLTSEQAEHLLVIGKAMYPGEKLHLDHIVPLSKGGGTTLANMHAIPARLNCSKYDKLPGETYKQGTLI